MPTYEYACRACGDHIEVVQSFKDDSLTECPACKGELRKVFSAAGIIFKGSGWHIKDYANKSNVGGGSSSDSSSSSSNSSSKESSSSDSSSKESSTGSGSSKTESSSSSTDKKSSTSTDKKSA
ncbi:MAG: putative FmdB family regulatory protein [Glaciecola sp.]|jgi:putative FmdB family regulatory protein